jgi:Mg2+ and Co2+ transporter CorA
MAESERILELQRRVLMLEQALKDKDRQIERFLRDQDMALLSTNRPVDGVQSVSGSNCANCEHLKQRWRKIHAHFQEVPRLLDAMIDRTDRLFEEL